MNQQERLDILSKAKIFFKNGVGDNHIKNTLKLADINKFNINPFTHKYLSNFAFGTQLQYFCNEVLSAYASTTSGADIELSLAQQISDAGSSL